MGKSEAQDYMTECLLRCIAKRGNKARGNYDKRKIDLSRSFVRTECGVGNYRRVDIFMWLTYIGEHSPLKQTYCIECKNDVGDLKSGYGLNFVGDRNFLLTWKDRRLYQHVVEHLDSLKRNDVGILLVDDKGRIGMARPSAAHHEGIYEYFFIEGLGDYIISDF